MKRPACGNPPGCTVPRAWEILQASGKRGPQPGTHLSRRANDTSTHFPARPARSWEASAHLGAARTATRLAARPPGLPASWSRRPQGPATCLLRVPAERRLLTRGAEARRRDALRPSRRGPVAAAEPPARQQQLASFHDARAGTGPHAGRRARSAAARAARRPRPSARRTRLRLLASRLCPCAPSTRGRSAAAAPAVPKLTVSGGLSRGPCRAVHKWGSVQRGTTRL